MLALVDSKQEEWRIVRREAENLTSAFATGVVNQGGAWHLTPRSSHADGRRFLLVALSVAANALHLEHVACVRACRGVPSMPVVKQFVTCEVLVWLRGNSVDEVVRYTLGANDFSTQFPARKLPNQRVVDRGLFCAILERARRRLPIGKQGSAADPVVCECRGPTPR